MQYLKLELAALSNCDGGSSCFEAEMALALEFGDPRVVSWICLASLSQLLDSAGGLFHHL